MLRSLLAATCLTAVAVGVPASPGAAAPPERCRTTPDIEAAAKQSEVVVLGTVTDSATRTVGTGAKKQRVREHIVDVDRTYQGTLTSSPITVTSSAGARGLPAIASDDQWLLFLNGSGEAFTAADCSGSRAATSWVITQTERTLGTGKAWVEPTAEPDPLRYEQVDTSDPLPLSRLVAPGLAATLVGLLGLLVTRRRRG